MRLLFLGPRRWLFPQPPVRDLINYVVDSGHYVESAVWGPKGAMDEWDPPLKGQVHEFPGARHSGDEKPKSGLRSFLKQALPGLTRRIISVRNSVFSLANIPRYGWFACLDRLGRLDRHIASNPYHPARLREWVGEIIRSGNFDAIFAIEADALVLAGEAMPDKPIPVVYDSLELYTETFRKRELWDISIKYHERSHARRARCVIIQDADRARILKEDLRLEKADFFFLPFGPLGKESVEGSSLLREQFALPPETKMVTQIGSISHTRLSDEIAFAAENFPPGFVMVFHGLVLLPLKELIEGRSIDKVYISQTLLSYEEVEGLYASSHIGIVFYTDSNLNDYYTVNSSYQLAAYLKAGVPVIVRKYPVWEQALARNQFGVCVDTPAQIPDAIRMIDADYETFSLNARRAFVEHYDLGLYAGALVEKIERMSAITA